MICTCVCPATGIFSSGLQILLPISPRYLIMLYDPAAYQTGKKRPVDIACDNIYDIEQLNLFQTINAGSNIYFSPAGSADPYLLKLNSKASRYRTQPKTTTNRVRPAGAKPGGVYINQKTSFPSIGLNLSFLKIRKKSKRTYSNKYGGPLSRSPVIAELFREYQEHNENHIHKFKTFNDFMKNHMLKFQSNQFLP